MENMNYWITGIITILAGILGSTGFWMLVQNQREKKSKERIAITAMLFMAVKMSCKSCLRRGWVSTEEIEDIEKYMFEPYKSMGGNGTAEMLMKKIKDLPNIPLDSADEDDLYNGV
jgi:hypothetical protein